jgi:hypothetical protein
MFIRSVRLRFAELFHEYGFVERETLNMPGLAMITATNDTHFLEVASDFREKVVEAEFGPLVGALIPDHSSGPRTVSEVRSVRDANIVWLATGDKAAGYGEWRRFTTTAESIDGAVTRLAERLSKHGAKLLAGDAREWERVAELRVTRVWRPA